MAAIYRIARYVWIITFFNEFSRLAAFYINQDLFKSKLLTKNSKLRMYKTLVRQTSSNICLWNVGTKRKHKNETKGIWEEGTKKNLWTH